ncbi:MAG: hypothetical protein JW852_00460 [Spirochaetales bacterium]|nr:hypothetical protein [Spirochaetales bacterium]
MKRIIAVLGVLLCACAADTPVFDDIVITVGDFAEYGDDYCRAGRVILSIENPTPVPVCGAAISLSLATNNRCYYTTVHDERGIPPGMEVFIAVEFVYISAEERADISGVSVIGSYFF